MLLRPLARGALLTVSPSSTLAEVARLMDTRGVDVAVVAERRRPVGVVTTHDIVVRGQIVVCPGVNDGAVLADTMAGILDQYPELDSVAVVLYWSQGLHATAVLFVVYVLIAVRGYFAWRADIVRPPALVRGGAGA